MRDSPLLLRARFTLIATALLIAAPAGFALAGSAHPQAGPELLANSGFEPLAPPRAISGDSQTEAQTEADSGDRTPLAFLGLALVSAAGAALFYDLRAHRS